MVTEIRSAQRIALGVAATALALGSLTACGGAGGAGEADGPVVIGMNSGLIPQFESYIEVYNAIDPDLQVELQPIPDAPADYLQQLVTQNISADLPDILFNYDSLNQQLAGNGLLFDLRPWLEQEKDGLANDFIPAFIEQYVADPSTGAIGGLPVSADSTMLFYNRDLFAQAGVTDLPSEDWTWEDLYAAAEQISDAGDGGYWGLQTPVRTGDVMYVDFPFLEAAGSSIYDADADEFVFADTAGLETWEFLLEPYTDGWGTPAPQGDNIDYFGAGTAAMTLDTRPAIARYRDALPDSDWDVINIPTYNGETTVGGGSYGLSISEKSSRKDAAWKFFAWFYSTDGGMAEAEPNGVIPATEDGLANGAWRDDDSPVPANLLPATEFAVENAKPPTPFPDATAADLSPTLIEALQKVTVSGDSVEDAFTSAQDTLNEILSR